MIPFLHLFHQGVVIFDGFKQAGPVSPRKKFGDKTRYFSPYKWVYIKDMEITNHKKPFKWVCISRVTNWKQIHRKNALQTWYKH